MTVINSVGNALTGSTGTGTFVGSASPTFTGTPILATPSATSLTFTSTSGIIGTTTNNNAAAGSVGEEFQTIRANASALGLTTTTATIIATFTLTAGDWDIWGNLTFNGDATTNTTALIGWVGSAAETAIDPSLSCATTFGAAGLVIYTSGREGIICPQRRVSLTGNTVYNLYAFSIFSVSTTTCCGGIYARRRR
jgi:hypothetical protein